VGDYTQNYSDQPMFGNKLRKVSSNTANINRNENSSASKTADIIKFTGDTTLLQDRSFMSLAFQLLSFRIIKISYMFSWLRFGSSGIKLDNHHEGLQDRAKDQMVNVALLSALMLTIWVSIAFLGGDLNATAWDKVQDIAGVMIVSAVVFHFISMVNATLIVMMLNSCTDDTMTHKFIELIGINLIVPMIEFYVGCICGLGAFMLNIYAEYHENVFWVSLAIFIILAVPANAIYYQYNVLALESVYKERALSKEEL
jgi:hypothetical protein